MPPTNSTEAPKPTEPALLLDVAAVAQLLGVSPRHVWRMADAGEFPRPVAVGAKLKRWLRAAVLTWIESQTAATSRR
jgi:predicted DNA-binding transcriptional regulator AlpA